MEDTQQNDGHRLTEVQRPGSRHQTLVRSAQVSLDVVAVLFCSTGQQGPRVHQYHWIVVDVDDAALRRHPLRDLVCVVQRGKSGTDIQELPHSGLACGMTYR